MISRAGWQGDIWQSIRVRYHESGHAIYVLMIEGKALGRVSIVPDGKAVGLVTFAGDDGNAFDLDQWVHARHKRVNAIGATLDGLERARRWIKQELSGLAGEALWLGEVDLATVSARDDGQVHHELGAAWAYATAAMHEETTATARLVRVCWHETLAALHRPDRWRAVEAVADTLKQDGELDGAQVAAIVAKATGQPVPTQVLQ